MTIIRHYQYNENNIGRIKFQLVINILCRSKLDGKMHFAGRFFVFLTEVKISLILILQSEIRLCRETKFRSTV